MRRPDPLAAKSDESSAQPRNDPQFAYELGSLCGVYCDDAFDIAHRGFAVRPS